MGGSLRLLLSRKRLFGLSVLLILITIALTWAGYLVTVHLVDGLTVSLMKTPPATDSIWGWVKYSGWVVSDWLLLVVSRIVAFYFAFLLAYTLTTPGYAFLSAAAERVQAGDAYDADEAFTFTGLFRDMVEGAKIALFGLAVTVAALVVNLIPGLGQLAVILLYTYYSALMFIDYPASRRRWPLGRKIEWLRVHAGSAFRIGFLPALISMIPVLNIFVIALLFPVLTVHATLNFSSIELSNRLAVRATGDKYGPRD
jgi:CysZ protein